MKFLDILKKYEEDGLIYSQTHPTLPLTIWKYSKLTHYMGQWDDVTVLCRGIVTDDETGEVVGRPFKKFWNLEEKKHTPTNSYDIFMKLDGSLLIYFYYKGQWVVASSGSFTSPQAIMGSEMLNEYGTEWLDKDYTYLFELIGNKNRIVVNYGDFNGVVMIGMINTQSGYEPDFHTLDTIHPDILKVTKYTNYDNYTDIKKFIDDNEEGFVVKFDNGERIKIKGEEYLRLHKSMTNVYTTKIWKKLREGENLSEVLEDIPDEFFNRIRECETELIDGYKKIETEIRNEYLTLRRPMIKQIAEIIKDNKNKDVIFSMMNGSDYSKYIWRRLKPKSERI